MISIKAKSNVIKIIQRSKFIALGYNIEDINQIKTIIQEVKTIYPDATHYCYGARINQDQFSYSDDGEPSYTAGIKIYQAMEGYDLHNSLIIVVRYFGGIKLGVGPLGKAYQDIAIELIKDNQSEVMLGSLVTIEFNYDRLKNIEHFLNTNKINIVNKDFDKTIKYQIFISKNQSLNSLANYLINVKIDKDNTYYYG